MLLLDRLHMAKVPQDLLKPLCSLSCGSHRDWRWLCLWRMKPNLALEVPSCCKAVTLFRATTAAELLRFTALSLSLNHHWFGIPPWVMTSGKCHHPVQPGSTALLSGTAMLYFYTLAASILKTERRLQCIILWLYKLPVLKFFDSVLPSPGTNCPA